jgi:hypothetical protein
MNQFLKLVILVGVIGLIVGLKWGELYKSYPKEIGNSESFTNTTPVPIEEKWVSTTATAKSTCAQPFLSLPIRPSPTVNPGGQTVQLTDALMDMAKLVDSNRIENNSRYMPANIDEYKDYVFTRSDGMGGNSLTMPLGMPRPKNLTTILRKTLEPTDDSHGRHSTRTRFM